MRGPSLVSSSWFLAKFIAELALYVPKKVRVVLISKFGKQKLPSPKTVHFFTDIWFSLGGGVDSDVSNWNFFEIHVNHGPVSPSNFFYLLSFLSSQGGIKLGWQNSEQLADIGLLVRTIVRSFTSCGRSFVITYAASAPMSQYFLSSSFAPHTCVVLIYLLSFLPEIKTHKLINSNE